MIFLDKIFFWKKSINFWHPKLPLKVRFWHFLTNRNSSTDFLIFFPLSMLILGLFVNIHKVENVNGESWKVVKKTPKFYHHSLWTGTKDSWKLTNIRKSKAPLSKPSRRYATIETLFSLSCKIHLDSRNDI